MNRRLNVFFLLAALFLTPLIFSQVTAQQLNPPDTGMAVAVPVIDSTVIRERTPQPAYNIVAVDQPNDAGNAIRVTWDISPDDFDGGKVKEYLILRSESPDGPFEELGNATQGMSNFIDNQAASGTEFYYKILALNFEKVNGNYLWRAEGESAVVGPIKSSAQWFNFDRMNIFVGLLILCSGIIYFIFAAKSGKTFYIRKIAGIEEVENAVGRATEMGRSVYYVPGIHDMDDVQTLASMTILGRVSFTAAENDTRIDVPVCRSMVMVTAREVVKEAYSKAGRPDNFQEDQVRYVTDDQFGYAAALDGFFVREKPATVFLIGTFFAESLILAETGNSIGAIQIAGTAMPAQLPFFVAACDYTLIGEELFAASAYLSREAKLLGSLKGQDLGKAVFLVAIVVGVILEHFGLSVSGLFLEK
jgi:hypothetical protein